MSGLAEEELDQRSAGRWLRIGGGVALAVLASVALVFLLKDLGGSSAPPKKQVTRITVLPDTPPPPPPPPPKEEPKQVKETKEVKVEQPKPVELPQEAQQLKMEGQAGDGPSPFAAGAVRNDYIGGEVGKGKGGGLAQFAFFSNALQRHIQEELARNRKVKLIDYRVMVHVWLGADGSIRRAELMSTTGSADNDDALRTALTEIGPMRTAVPENLPQPIKLRITNRMTG